MEIPDYKKIEQLLSEIQSVREQWQAEVGSGGRAWPRAIKSRVLELVEMDVPRAEIARKTGVPYETLNLWLYKKRRKDFRQPGFHDISVGPQVGNELVAVTATNSPTVSGSIRIVTPKGYSFEGLGRLEFFEVVRCLGGLHVL